MAFNVGGVQFGGAKLKIPKTSTPEFVNPFVDTGQDTDVAGFITGAAGGPTDLWKSLMGLAQGANDDPEKKTVKDRRKPVDPAASRFAEFQLRQGGKLPSDSVGRAGLVIPRNTELAIPT